MNTYRTQAQLSHSIRALARIREQLESGRPTWFGRLVYLYRFHYNDMRIRYLIERLHSH